MRVSTHGRAEANPPRAPRSPPGSASRLWTRSAIRARAPAVWADTSAQKRPQLANARPASRHSAYGGCRVGTRLVGIEARASGRSTLVCVGEFAVGSDAFGYGEEIPRRHTCEGEDVS